MQTFLPYRNFHKTARVLDRQRLGKQRVENMQIMQAIVNKNLGVKSGWQNHPAVIMWEDHLVALWLYQLAITGEWIDRGYKDTCRDKSRLIFKQANEIMDIGDFPVWLGNPLLHDSHQAALVSKMPEHYAPIFGDLKFEGYYWPNQTERFFE